MAENGLYWPEAAFPLLMPLLPSQDAASSVSTDVAVAAGYEHMEFFWINHPSVELGQIAREYPALNFNACLFVRPSD